MIFHPPENSELVVNYQDPSNPTGNQSGGDKEPAANGDSVVPETPSKRQVTRSRSGWDKFPDPDPVGFLFEDKGMEFRIAPFLNGEEKVSPTLAYNPYNYDELYSYKTTLPRRPDLHNIMGLAIGRMCKKDLDGLVDLIEEGANASAEDRTRLAVYGVLPKVIDMASRGGTSDWIPVVLSVCQQEETYLAIAREVCQIKLGDQNTNDMAVLEIGACIKRWGWTKGHTPS